jgi:hypothetical protein
MANFFKNFDGADCSGGYENKMNDIDRKNCRDPCNLSRWILDLPFSVGTNQSFQIFNSYNGGTHQILLKWLLL